MFMPLIAIIIIIIIIIIMVITNPNPNPNLFMPFKSRMHIKLMVSINGYFLTI